MEDNKQALSDGLSEEIQVYRRRQLTTFREVLIVQALITWGIGQLGIDEKTSADVISLIRFVATGACVVAGVVGIWIILAYKERIYHLRDGRNYLADCLVPPDPEGSDPNIYPGRKWYYPTDVKKMPTSYIYSFTIVAFSLFTGAVNFWMGRI